MSASIVPRGGRGTCFTSTGLAATGAPGPAGALAVAAGAERFDVWCERYKAKATIANAAATARVHLRSVRTAANYHADTPPSHFCLRGLCDGVLNSGPGPGPGPRAVEFSR